MKYRIHHTTTYHYDTAVVLQPHIMRLRPRCDGNQRVPQFDLAIAPTPIGYSENTDLDGNAITKVWFDPAPTRSLTIHALSMVETTCTNPFNYILEPWATQLPLDYPALLLAQLQPYLGGQHPSTAAVFDPAVVQFAQDLWVKSDGHPSQFLTMLNLQIYAQCHYQVRESGNPLPPGVTWAQKAGSCRDFAVLFMEVCRVVGLAARFVSGYQEGDLDSRDRHLHAWVEVYLPGAGWRGFDPTHGLAVSDRHIALAASAFASYTAPVLGAFSPGGTRSQMDYELQIEFLDHPDP